MPRNFLTSESVKQAAKSYGFRPQEEDEPDVSYRQATHEHILPIDRVEAYEVLFGISWDQWTGNQKRIAMQLAVSPQNLSRAVPNTCLMAPVLLSAIEQTEFPCDRCNADRENCKGYPRK